jgi:hypothetical protein
MNKHTSSAGSMKIEKAESSFFRISSSVLRRKTRPHYPQSDPKSQKPTNYYPNPDHTFKLQLLQAVFPDMLQVGHTGGDLS